MSSSGNDKLATQKFLENAFYEGGFEQDAKGPKKESEKLIIDEVLNEKSPKNIETIDSGEPKISSPLTPSLKNSEDDENTLEETESLEGLDVGDHNEPPKILDEWGPKEEQQLDVLAENSSEGQPEVKEELTDILEETESARDLKSSDRDIDDEDKSQEVTKEAVEEWQDILGSGVVMKKILKEGEPNMRPVRSNKCLVSYTSRLEEADEEDFAEKIDSYELGLGEGDVVQGLDVALSLMNKHERCLLKIGPRLAYGDKGLPPNIPGNATVMFDVELLDVQQEDEIEALSVQDRRKMGNKKRERGNWWYQRGENTLAVQCYRRALDFLDEVESDNAEHKKPTDAELQELLEDRLKVLNNMASAQIKMELYDQALMSLQTVLKCQPNNVKALFRNSKIHVAKNNLPQALKLLEKAKALEPEDSSIAREITSVTGLINKQKNSEREYARRMFGGTSPTGSSSKTKVGKDGEKPETSKIQFWATLGATAIVGLAGVIAYKFKYP